MSVKKTRDVRFTFQDASGALRAIHIQLLHEQEGRADRVQVIATSDGIPITATARVGAASKNKVKTKSRL